jgi:hypothetical protein
MFSNARRWRWVYRTMARGEASPTNESVVAESPGDSVTWLNRARGRSMISHASTGAGITIAIRLGPSATHDSVRVNEGSRSASAYELHRLTLPELFDARAHVGGQP